MKNPLLLTLGILLTSIVSAQMVLSFDTVPPYTVNGDPCNGSLTVHLANASDETTYQWSDGSTGNTAYDLCAQVYCVTVTDPVLCRADLLCTVTQCIDLGNPT